MSYASSDDLHKALNELSLFQDKIDILQSTNSMMQVELDLLKQESLTEEEARLAVRAVKQVHIPESDFDSMDNLAYDTCLRLQAIVARFEKKRSDLSSFAATLTPEERELIEKRRAGITGVLLCGG